MSVVVSLTDLTTQAAWMAGLAIAALVLAGWRKNARATARTPRGEPMLRRSWEPVPIAETTTSLYKRPSLLRRVWAAVASTGIAIVIGAVSAIVIAFATGWLVITLTDLLKT
jgi:ABC-type nitrate/sulfonate/bicarbonate transport system permease component